MYYVYIRFVRKTADQVRRGEIQWNKWVMTTKKRSKQSAIDVATGYKTHAAVTQGQTADVVFDNGHLPIIDPSI